VQSKLGFEMVIFVGLFFRLLFYTDGGERSVARKFVTESGLLKVAWRQSLGPNSMVISLKCY
jgi:hypothetical protein